MIGLDVVHFKVDDEGEVRVTVKQGCRGGQDAGLTFPSYPLFNLWLRATYFPNLPDYQPHIGSVPATYNLVDRSVTLNLEPLVKANSLYTHLATDARQIDWKEVADGCTGDT